MVFVGPVFPGKITALASLDDFTYVSIGSVIYVVDRNVIVSKIEMKKERIESLMILGDAIIAVGQSSFYLIDCKTYGII